MQQRHATMQNYIIPTMQRATLALVIFVGCGFSHNVKAEWLWCDRAAIKAEFEKLITDNLPKGCHAPKDSEFGLFPREDIWLLEDKKEIAYQVDIYFDNHKQCFNKLTKKLTQLKAKNKLSVRNKIPKHLFLGDKQSDNSIIFYFDATESEIRDVKGKPCDSVKSQK
jgi:hypothetical protein